MNLNASHLPVLGENPDGACQDGVQVILLSHSLFLLRECMIQLSGPRNAEEVFRDDVGQCSG